MITCDHCHNPLAAHEAELYTIQANVETEPCWCITASCGHLISPTLDEIPPCEQCDRCETCCPCVCDRCGHAMHAAPECGTCP